MQRAKRVMTTAVVGFGLSWPGTVRAQDEEVEVIQLEQKSDANHVILCHIDLRYPHRSSTAPGLVDVKAQVRCSSVVPTLLLDLGLLYYGFESATKHFAATWNSVLGGTTFDQCRTGDWQGVLGWYIEYPMGYKLPSDRGMKLTPSRYVSCATASSGGGGGGGGYSGGGGSPDRGADGAEGSGGTSDNMCTCEGFTLSCNFLCPGSSGSEGSGGYGYGYVDVYP